ncbi:hypothetical protein QHH11_02040 [Aphanizomenon sp. PH219]|uniref:HEPN domain-containing protein n=1 Tax=Dolichospermum heterosporum TAC447 TaxID=747523 RepID=A0ABY5LPU5_9CYAN|nr:MULTISPECIES: hypothetical protein [Aphanizomenonaceae]MDK2408643.1 hypothetical protein [Aphanizomenon sp. 202]MDK2457930.1 hypothetical protein [Aphanizomenon sp. PH219]UUO13983.1 hypothetical protein NG743_18260 [Dolichospermum heterosporum TAC447]
MTEPSIYLLQAQANEESAKIAQKDFPEWAIIMYFYAALHLINDYALELNQIDLLKVDEDSKISQHSLRREYVKTISNYINCKDLQANYDFLFNESLLARYLVNRNDILECSAREYYSQYTDKDFLKIRDKLEQIKIRLEQAQKKHKAGKSSKK